MADPIAGGNMKKIIVFFIVLSCFALFLACNSKIRGREEASYHNYLDNAGTYNGAVIPNKECAVAVAEAIFNNMEKSERSRNYTQQSVSFDEDNQIWIVSFWEPTNLESSNIITLGNDCSIAIQKADGKVLRIWFGE